MSVRLYEVQLWTLQDDFITVLKENDVENKGQIQEPNFKNNIDGTQNFSFKIPMYIYDGAKRIENPIWYTVRDGFLIANLRKIKLILNKARSNSASANERIYEFVITKVSESHEGDMLYCSVECEGLAFHELGKVGYKISLSADDFNNDSYEYFRRWEGSTTLYPPVANINYWLDKFLTSYYDDTQPNVLPRNPKTWYYTIQMQHHDALDGVEKLPNKIYEDAYIANWNILDPQNDNNYVLVPETMVSSKEKERLIDLEESNIYNLTQDLAEKFGVFCKYQYQYDSNYHIIGRLIIFYNNFFNEKNDSYLDITYPYSASAISRSMDGSSLTTKLFVRPTNDSEGVYNGIIDVPANKSLEDYILNFDYLHEINTISEEQYDEVDNFETDIRVINEWLKITSETLLAYEVDYPEYQAKKITLDRARALDAEQVAQYTALLNSVTEQSGLITLNDSAPESVIPLIMPQENNNTTTENNTETQKIKYYIKPKNKNIIIPGQDKPSGIEGDPIYVQIYKNWTAVPQQPQNEGDTVSQLSNPIESTFTYKKDEAGNIIQIEDIKVEFEQGESYILYMIYSYIPNLYYTRVAQMYQDRYETDVKEYEKVSIIVDKFDKIINALNSYYNYLLAQKQRRIERFERIMRPALREGYWQPEDYRDFGDRYETNFALNTYTYQEYERMQVEDEQHNITLKTKDSLIITLTNQSINCNDSNQYDNIEFLWEQASFENEDKSYYLTTTKQDREYYPIYNLNHIGSSIYDMIKENINSILFTFFQPTISTTHETKNRKVYAINSQMQYGFVKSEYYTDPEAFKEKARGNPPGGWGLDETWPVLKEVYNGQQIQISDTFEGITYENAPCLIMTGAKSEGYDTATFNKNMLTYFACPMITTATFFDDWIQYQKTLNEALSANNQTTRAYENTLILNQFTDFRFDTPLEYDGEIVIKKRFREYEFVYETVDNAFMDWDSLWEDGDGKDRADYWIDGTGGIVYPVSENGGEVYPLPYYPVFQYKVCYKVTCHYWDAQLTNNNWVAIANTNIDKDVAFFIIPLLGEKECQVEKNADGTVKGDMKVIHTAFSHNGTTILPYDRIRQFYNNPEIRAGNLGKGVFYPNNSLYIKKDDGSQLYTEPPAAQRNDYFLLNTDPQLYYPRIIVKSLRLKLDEDSLQIKLGDIKRMHDHNEYNLLTNYEDYYILQRSGLRIPVREADSQEVEEITLENLVVENLDTYDNNDISTLYGIVSNLASYVYPASWYITLKPFTLFEAGIKHDDSISGSAVPTTLAGVNIRYILSNADLSIYLDAKKVSKENAYPKVEYSVTPSFYNQEHILTADLTLGRIVHINDNDLKFENVQGYISEVNLNLDSPNNDIYEIKNYKTKFEDLFANIVAQSQEMQKAQVMMDTAASCFTVNGHIQPEVLQQSVSEAVLELSYNNDRLKINNTDGIIGIFSDGAIKFNNTGLYYANKKIDGIWQWNSALTANGLNLHALCGGQLDLSQLKISAGGTEKFQINAEGIFAYKSYSDEMVAGKNIILPADISDNSIGAVTPPTISGELDVYQYVKFGDDGLHLMAKEGTKYLQAVTAADTGTSSDGYIYKQLDSAIERVEISWDGLILRDWNNEKVFYADPDTGNLVLKGSIYADSGYFKGAVYADSGYFGQFNTNVNNGWAITISNEFDGTFTNSSSEEGRFKPDRPNYLEEIYVLAGYTTSNNNIVSSSYVGLGGAKSNYALWAGATQPIWYNADVVTNQPLYYAPLSLKKNGEVRLEKIYMQGYPQPQIRYIPEYSNWKGILNVNTEHNILAVVYKLPSNMTNAINCSVTAGINNGYEITASSDADFLTCALPSGTNTLSINKISQEDPYTQLVISGEIEVRGSFSETLYLMIEFYENTSSSSSAAAPFEVNLSNGRGYFSVRTTSTENLQFTNINNFYIKLYYYPLSESGGAIQDVYNKYYLKQLNIQFGEVSIAAPDNWRECNVYYLP